MPTYAYTCTSCQHSLEVRQSFTDDALTECPQCHGRLRKRFDNVGVVFKGSGFYRNDSRAPEGSGRSGKSGSSSDGTGSSSSDKSGSKDSGSAGSSSAAKSSSEGGGSTAPTTSSSGSSTGPSSSTSSSGSSSS